MTEMDHSIRKARLEIMQQYGLLLWDEASVQHYIALDKPDRAAYIKQIIAEDGYSGWMAEHEDEYAAR